ncbi:MAG: hypothetical protein RJA76_721 [Bacteroidota bacterium]
MDFNSPLENLVSISIASIAPSNLGSNSYILLLKSNEDNQSAFPIVIGPAEAQTISVYLEDVEIPRPLTSQLILSILNSVKISIKQVVITDFIDGIFYSTIYLEKESEIIKIDSRPSDSIALAVKTQAPIFVYRKLLASICIPNEKIEDYEEEVYENNVPELSITDLTNQLESALDKEDYESAAKIRDQIEKLKN